MIPVWFIASVAMLHSAKMPTDSIELPNSRARSPLTGVRFWMRRAAVQRAPAQRIPVIAPAATR